MPSHAEKYFNDLCKETDKVSFLTKLASEFETEWLVVIAFRRFNPVHKGIE